MTVGERTGRRRSVLAFGVLAALTVPGLFAPTAAANDWAMPALVDRASPLGGGSYDPQVAFDDHGNGVAVWAQSNASRTAIWASRYVPGAGWEAPQLLQSEGGGDASFPQLAVEGRGNAIAVWMQSDGVRTNIVASRFTVGYGWGPAVFIETNSSGSAASPSLALDSTGNATVVWYQYDGTRNNIWANRYVVGAGWGTAALLETDDVSSAYDPRVAVDASGNAVVVWEHHNGTWYNIWARRYSSSTGWEPAQLIEMDDTGHAADPRVAMDKGGNAVVVWAQSDGTRQNIWANRYVPGPGWGTAELLETENFGTAQVPRVAVDPSGNAIAVWHQRNVSRDDIWANRYAVGVGWGAAELIETNNSGNARDPVLAVDGIGNAVAAWGQSDGVRTNIWANRFDVAKGWGTAELLERENTNAVGGIQAAFDPAGNAAVLWAQPDLTNSRIWATILVEDDPPVLSLSSPTDGLTTNRSTVWVAGVTEPGATLVISGVTVSVAEDGSFGFWMALWPGTGIVQATASDRAGNTATAAAVVTFADPVPALEQDLAAAQAELAVLQADLTAAEAALGQAEADLAARGDQIAALESQANQTGAQLTEAFANVTAAQARVTALEAAGNVTQQELDAAQADLSDAAARVTTLEAEATAIQLRLNASQLQLSAAQANHTAALARVTALETSVASTQAALVVAQGNQAAAEARIGALENRTATVGTPAAGGDSGLAMILGAAGVGVGVVGCALALRSKRPAAPAVPPESPKPR